MKAMLMCGALVKISKNERIHKFCWWLADGGVFRSVLQHSNHSLNMVSTKSKIARIGTLVLPIANCSTWNSKEKRRKKNIF